MCSWENGKKKKCSSKFQQHILFQVHAVISHWSFPECRKTPSAQTRHVAKKKCNTEKESTLYGAHITPWNKKIRAGNKSSSRNKTKDAHTQCMKDYNDRLQKCVTQMYNEKHRKAGEQIRSPYVPRPTHSIWASDDMFFGFTASLMMCYCRQHSVQNITAVSVPRRKTWAPQPPHVKERQKQHAIS